MRAAVVEEYGAPWVIEERPDPRAAAGQVVVRVEASGVCGTDVHLHRGHLPFVSLPVVAGHEPVGRVVEVGPGVTRLAIGDRVGVSWVQRGCGRCRACQRGHESQCADAVTWMSLGGGNAELMVAEERGCTLVPEGVAPEVAAPIFCAGYTVLSGIRAAAPRAGERIAVLGVGGLGHLAVQLAGALGHEVVAVTGTPDKKQGAIAMGADEVIVAGDDAGAALADAGGADVIVATTNAATHVAQALRGLRAGGRLVNLGSVDGPLEVQASTLMFPPRTLLGASQGARADLVDALELVAAGKVAPQLEVYPLDEVNDVLARLEAGKVRYRAVLTHAS